MAGLGDSIEERNGFPRFRSVEYWESSPDVRAAVLRVREEKRARDLRERMDLSWNNPDEYRRRFGDPYYGRL